MKKCPYCLAEIQDTASTCSVCGNNFSNPETGTQTSKTLRRIVLVIGLGIIIPNIVLFIIIRPSLKYSSIAERALKNMTTSDKSHYGMAEIPEGEFLMGSPDGIGNSNEHPAHKVYLDNFHMDQYEVTVADFRKFAKATSQEMRSQPLWSTDKHPVVNVDWNDAEAYCQWVGKRLPTEAEWEKAARGRTNTKWSFGGYTFYIDDYIWYDGNSGGQAHPVGEKKPNYFDLYDMHGNVWEWTADWYDEKYFEKSPPGNPRGTDTGKSRVIRGGSWNDHDTHSASRAPYSPDNSLPTIGFRCAS